jgi:hypothetical protein
VSPVKYELGLYIPEDDILHTHRRENLKFALFYSRIYSPLEVHTYICDFADFISLFSVHRWSRMQLIRSVSLCKFVLYGFPNISSFRNLSHDVWTASGC